MPLGFCPAISAGSVGRSSRSTESPVFAWSLASISAPRFLQVSGRGKNERHWVLVAQSIGSAIVTVSTFAAAFAVMKAVHAMGLLRVSQDGEALGLDLHEHGISAYPEYVISALGKPSAVVLHATGRLSHEAPAQMPAIEPTT